MVDVTFDYWYDPDYAVGIWYLVGRNQLYRDHEVQVRADGIFCVRRRSGQDILRGGKLVAGPFDSIEAAKAACILVDSAHG